MTGLDIAHQRLLNLGIARASVDKRALFEKPGDVVSWLVAVQAQDFSGAKWALGQRMRAATDSVVEQAFTEGSILRTHLMRPTWHFVTPTDIRWMLALTAPRVHAVNAAYYRKLELDQTLFTRSNDALVKALQGGEQLTRYVIIVDGQIVGTWKRTLKKDAVVLEMNIFTPLTDAEEQAVTVAASRYGAFLGLLVVLG